MSADTAFNCTLQPAADIAVTEFGIIGIGNTLMGDDGAGIIAMEKLRAFPALHKKSFFHALCNDLFEMAELIDRAKRFIFIDAYIGSPAGVITVFSRHRIVPMPSLHQTDIGTVMRMLEPLDLCDPFPDWEIRGIAVEPPLHLGEGLCAPVARAVDWLVEDIRRFVT
jgi:hydrogenase maturation protease